MMRTPSVGQCIERRCDFESEFTEVVSTPELLPAVVMPPDFAWRVRVVGGCGLGMVTCGPGLLPILEPGFVFRQGYVQTEGSLSHSAPRQCYIGL